MQFLNTSVPDSTAQQMPSAIAFIGPWGSGKTTSLQLALLGCGVDRQEIGVIFVEFGEINIDEERVVAANKVVISERCICCSGVDALIQAVNQLKDKVSLLLIEASGVSDGADVRRVLSRIGLSYRVVAHLNLAEIDRDIDLYVQQLANADMVFGTHSSALGSAHLPQVSKWPFDCLIDLKDLVMPAPEPSERWRQMTSAPCRRPTFFSLPGQQASYVDVCPVSQHVDYGVSTISLVLHETIRVADLREFLKTKAYKFDRAKGVVTDTNDIRRDFDCLGLRSDRTASIDESNGENLDFKLSGNRSNVSVDRNHIVLFARGREAALRHSDFIEIGVPNVTVSKILQAAARYPDHITFYETHSIFPVYSNQGDRYYGLLYPLLTYCIATNSFALQQAVFDELQSCWRTALGAYLQWRIRGISSLDALRQRSMCDAESQELIGAENLLTMNLLWHVIYLKNYIEKSIIEELRRLELGRRFFISMQLMKQPPEFSGKRIYSDELHSTLIAFIAYAIEVEDLCMEKIKATIQHVIDVDPTNTWLQGAPKLFL